jgi:integrase
VLDKLMVPRFGAKPLADCNGNALSLLDAEFVRDERADSSRRNVHILYPREVQMDDVDAVLAEAPESGQLAFALPAFAGLRASELRSLRWTDVDLKVDTITVRRARTGTRIWWRVIGRRQSRFLIGRACYFSVKARS